MGSRIDKIVRKRKSVKADRATEQGIAGHQAASKALGNAASWERSSLFGVELAQSTRPGSILDAPHTQSFKPGEGHVSIPEIGNGAPYRGDGWAGIEGVSNMEYKMFPGNPGPSVSKRPRKGNE